MHQSRVASRPTDSTDRKVGNQLDQRGKRSRARIDDALKLMLAQVACAGQIHRPESLGAWSALCTPEHLAGGSQ